MNINQNRKMFARKNGVETHGIFLSLFSVNQCIKSSQYKIYRNQVFAIENFTEPKYSWYDNAINLVKTSYLQENVLDMILKYRLRTLFVFPIISYHGINNNYTFTSNHNIGVKEKLFLNRPIIFMSNIEFKMLSRLKKYISDYAIRIKQILNNEQHNKLNEY